MNLEVRMERKKVTLQQSGRNPADKKAAADVTHSSQNQAETKSGSGSELQGSDEETESVRG